jgi:hypothetical protein
MQRSAAKSVNSEPSTPDGPPSKRMRMSNGGSAASTPGAPSDREIMQSALAAEEKKREEALARAYAHTGETKWVLNYNDPHAGKRPPVMQVRQAGFAVIDADDDSDEEEDRPIRMQFGGGLKKKKAVRGQSTQSYVKRLESAVGLHGSRMYITVSELLTWSCKSTVRCFC